MFAALLLFCCRYCQLDAGGVVVFVFVVCVMADCDGIGIASAYSKARFDFMVRM